MVGCSDRYTAVPRAGDTTTVGDLPTGTLTLLFSDIEGSTLTLNRLGERWGEALSAQRSILRSVFESHGGHEMGTEGDSFFVVFTSTRQAVLAAVEGQRLLQHHDWPDSVPVNVRMGLHTGEPTRHEDGYIGIDVHRAARIAGTASGGQVVLSESTRQLASPFDADIVVRDLGWHRLKDIAEPEHVYDLVVPGLRAEFPPLRSLGTRANLPTASSPLVGRDDQLAEVRSAMLEPHVRLMTLTGPGGSGKTRLAVAVASALEPQFPAGIFFTDLHTADRAAIMWLGIADTLDVTGDAEELPRERVQRFLGDRTALLVLDNLEQVVDADQVVSELLSAAPHVHVLATSRRPLHLVSEYEHPVPPLELPDGSSSPADAWSAGAVELFVSRARMVKPSFELTEENVADVSELCRRLDGLPLAIELAASRSKLLTPRALLSRLDHTLGSGVSAADRTERQRTLAATIAWSYDLLTESEQDVFRRLGVFSDQYDLTAVEAVVGAEGADPLDTVAHLVDISLVQIVDGPDGEPRISMLETIRAFARHQLDATPHGDEVRLRHARWCVERAAEVNQMLFGHSQIDALDRMSLIESDVRAALNWSLGSTTDHDDGRTGCGLQLVAAMTTYWYRFGYAAEGRGWFGRVLRLAETVETLEMANALHGVAVLQLQLGDISPAAEGLQRALDMVRRLGNRDAEARELNSLAVAHRERGDHAESRRLLEQSLRTAREIGNVRRESTALANLVMVLVDTADWEAALVASRQAVAASRALGDDWAAACDESNLAMALLRTEGADAAYAHLAAVAPRAVALEDNELSIAILELFAAIVAELGEDELAARLLAVSDRQRAVVGMPRSKPDQALLNRSLDASRARDDQGWLAAYEEGLRLDPTQAMAQAMSVRVTGGTTTGPVR